MNNDTNSLSHPSWNCKYHIVFAPKYRRKVFYDTVGKNTAKIAEYIANQLKEDKETEQMTITEIIDPFKKKGLASAKDGLWVSDFAMLVTEGYTLK